MKELEQYKEALKKVEELKVKAEEYRELLIKVGQQTCFSQIMFNRENGKVNSIDLLHTLFVDGNRLDYAISVDCKNKIKLFKPKFLLDYQHQDFFIDLLEAKNGDFKAGLGYYIFSDSEKNSDNCVLIDKANINNVCVGDFYTENTIKSFDIIRENCPELSVEDFRNLQIDMTTYVSSYKNFLNGETAEIDLDMNDKNKEHIIEDLYEILLAQKAAHLNKELSNLQSDNQPKRKLKL